jgi:hypothetical protein
MGMIITALFIQSGEKITHETDGKAWVEGCTRAIVKLKNRELVAELDLEKPEEGWKVYPN